MRMHAGFPAHRQSCACSTLDLLLLQALEVYAEMQREGCTPNIVTYNTLIDVYGKLGQWQEALGVLDTLRIEVHRLHCLHRQHTASACLHGECAGMGVRRLSSCIAHAARAPAGC